MLLFLFIAMPIAELWLLIRVGEQIGAGSTIALVLITGVVGANLARREGTRAMTDLMAAQAKGEMPTGALMRGAAAFAGGLLLLTPGLVTDVVGFALLIPPIRDRILGVVVQRLKGRIAFSGSVAGGGTGFRSPTQGAPGPGPELDPERVFDQSFEDPKE